MENKQFRCLLCSAVFQRVFIPFIPKTDPLFQSLLHWNSKCRLGINPCPSFETQESFQLQKLWKGLHVVLFVLPQRSDGHIWDINKESGLGAAIRAETSCWKEINGVFSTLLSWSFSDKALERVCLLCLATECFVNEKYFGENKCPKVVKLQWVVYVTAPTLWHQMYNVLKAQDSSVAT